MQSADDQSAGWTEVIQPSAATFDLRLRELWRYRDLISMLVRRDFVANYKQTVLGPAWFVIQPVLTSLTYALIFGRAAKLGPDNVPLLLFYMSGITIWTYFADCLTKTASVFKDNASMFGKVYFPRLVMPVSIVISHLMKFGVQMALFLAIWLYYRVVGRIGDPSPLLVVVPLLVVLMGLMGLGAGMIISALTTKYKDLVFLITFGVQLLMFSTPVLFPISRLPTEYHWIIRANPMSSIVEAYRFVFTHSGSFSWSALGYSTVWALLLLSIGAVIFNRVEKSFSDTV